MTETEEKPLVLDESRIPKPIFFDEPKREVVREIVEFVSATGRPQDWRGHTHTKPPDGSKPKYLDEFDVPTFGHIADRVAPCPCCSPDAPKYKRLGKIAWFPEEGVIRLIGPKCFASLNPEGHMEAAKELNDRKKREFSIRYLSGALPRVKKLLDVVERGVKIGSSIDEFRADILEALSLRSINLWNYCRDGKLYVQRSTTHGYIDGDGQHHTREVFRKEEYAKLHGWQTFEPEPSSLEVAFKQIKAFVVAVIAELERNPDVETWEDASLMRASQMYNKGRDRLVTTLALVSSIQDFAGPIAIPTLKGWGRDAGAPVRLFVERDGPDLKIGDSNTSWVKVLIPPSMDKRLPNIEEVDPGPA